MKNKFEKSRRYYERMVAKSPHTRREMKKRLIAQGVIKKSTTELLDSELWEVADSIRLEIEYPEMFSDY